MVGRTVLYALIIFCLVLSKYECVASGDNQNYVTVEHFGFNHPLHWLTCNNSHLSTLIKNATQKSAVQFWLNFESRTGGGGGGGGGGGRSTRIRNPASRRDFWPNPESCLHFFPNPDPAINFSSITRNYPIIRVINFYCNCMHVTTLY